MNETRDITCPKCTQVLGTIELPNDTDEKIWTDALRGHQCKQNPTNLGIARLDTNDATKFSDWMDCLHHNILSFNIASIAGPNEEAPNSDNFVIAIEHSADGENVDGEVTTKQGAGVVEDIDIDAYSNVRFKVKTAEGAGSWASIQGRTEFKQLS